MAKFKAKKSKAKKMNPLSQYWAYKKTGGKLSMKAYFKAVKDGKI